ncbi:uncharacterized protein [Rutidosis leptorrhynchoides]|uniref:uncharacterized protein n=1 Tax=Rutidosis leptorrhynchoides TaxID=125765 RepID=UPI003A9A370B
MEDSTAKTIDYLRAQLLAERSVSRTAKQRANELAKRVTELEKQLKFVSLQRKKAGKATIDVLAILESHGRNDLSEPFDSSTDQEGTSSDYKDGNHVETSENGKVRESDMEGFSGSEVESSSVNGRSLSWKSSKNSSSRFLEKKYMDASRRRRNSFTSTGSSPRRVGKSCRQIRHREHRSRVDGSQNEDLTNGQNEDPGRTNSEDVQNSADVGADVGAETSLEELDIYEKKDTLEVPTALCNGRPVQVYETERAMEKALKHQAQFIARFEEEEKAQREWEDKFRENNGSPPDSCDPGTHSDVTEERDESKAPVLATPPLCSTDKFAPESQEIDANFSEQPKTNSEPIPGQTNSYVISETSDIQNRPSDLQGTFRKFSPNQVSSSQDSSLLYNEEQTSGKLYEPTIGTRENSAELGSVLEALQQARLSLKQNLDKFPLLQNGPPTPTYRSQDNFTVPFNSADLFKLPTDYEYRGTTPRTNSLTFDPRLSLTKSSPYREPLSRSATSLDDRYRMVPTFPYHETMPKVPRLPPSSSIPRSIMPPSALDPRNAMHPSARDPRLDVGMPSSSLHPRSGVGPPVDLQLGVDQSAFDPRLGDGPSVDPRLTGDRYARSADRLHQSAGLPPYIRYSSLPGGDVPIRTCSFYDDYTRPST